MELNKIIMRYINLTNYREKFIDDSEPYKSATNEMRILERIIIREVSKEEKPCTIHK